MSWIEDNTNKDPMANVGMRIRMLSMNDEEHPVDQGLEGTINHIDGLGTIHVKWDDGRNLGVIPGLDEYQILPPKGEQIGPDNFESLFGESRDNPLTTRYSQEFKRATSQTRPKLRLEKENIKGGKAENMTPKDLAKKHDVSIKDIEKEIEVGVKIEMEHTDSKEKAKEIAMDHIAEFPDYYTNEKYGTIASEKGLEKVNEDKSTYTIKDDVERILKTIKTAKPQHKETILKMISNLEKKYQKKYGEKEKFVELIGTLREKVGKKFDIEETTTTGALGSSPIQPLGTDINRGKLSKTVSSDVVSKGNLKNPMGTVYTIKPKTESRIIKASDLLNEIANTDSVKLRDGGSYDGDSWVGDKGGWKRRKELAWKGGEISDILAKLDIDWTDSDLSLTDKETDKINNINEGWLFKSKEDRLALEILRRVKEEWPQDATDNYYGIEFTLPGVQQDPLIRIDWDGGDDPHIKVNGRKLDASRWAIKKLYKYMHKKITEWEESRDFRRIQADLTDPGYAQDVFDALGDSEQMNEAKKDKDIHTAKWDRCFEKVSKEKGNEAAAGICTDSIGYEGSIKKAHRRKDETIEEGRFDNFLDKVKSVFVPKCKECGEYKEDVGSYGLEPGPAYVCTNEECPKSDWYYGRHLKEYFGGNTGIRLMGKTFMSIKDVKDFIKSLSKKQILNWEPPNRESLSKWEKILLDKKKKLEQQDLDETTTFSSVWGVNGPPVTPSFAAPKGKHIPSKKPIWKGGKIVQKIDGGGVLVNEVNTIKWVKGGKFVKIKDKCTKFNNQPWCDAGNASNPLELSDTTFENVKRVSEKTGLSEQEILERIGIFKNGK